MTRDEALRIVNEKIKNQNLRKHMLAVEAAMKAYAKKFGQDEEQWAVAGLVHDAYYEVEPENHPELMAQHLEELGEKELSHAVHAHAYKAPGYRNGKIKPETKMAQALWAIDGLTGLIVAAALVRPDKIDTLEAKSVLKRMKEKDFAKGVIREHIVEGAEMLGVSLEEHVATVLEAMRGIKDQLF